MTPFELSGPDPVGAPPRAIPCTGSGRSAEAGQGAQPPARGARRPASTRPRPAQLQEQCAYARARELCLDHDLPLSAITELGELWAEEFEHAHSIAEARALEEFDLYEHLREERLERMERRLDV